jgi:hypothetical protein
MESVPLVLVGLFSSIQASEAARAVAAWPQPWGALIDHVWVAVVASALPAASPARTLNWCAPAASPVYSRGELQEANAAPSSEHSNVEPGSFDEKLNDALVLDVVAGGAAVIVVCGAVLSTVIAAGRAAVSVARRVGGARTSKVWAPSANAAVVCGELQTAKAPVSTRHWKLAPGSLENPNVGVESFVGPAGPESIVVCGAVVSTVQVKLAEVESGLPARSTARTSKVCEPWARPE